ncbi:MULTISPECIES: colicin E5-related ribonuclease [Gammaproteobacteria]|uniref:Colicin n=3 Tax=Gammaproteobacteria TaxID=1236 RepID=A0A514C8P7_MORMO|nr:MULTISPECIES: colicin E5-related ribonuclease [Gammaproteobacteria]QDH76047.1 hypothetical protein [Morganella morganii]QDX15397.1 hypothetical protein [Actinobacillus pleuropneumoniae]HCC5748407.1 hypothetical protein [Morganella morganii]
MSKNNSGGYNGSNLGGHTTDHGNGWSTTSDNRGDIGHHTDNGDSKGDHGWGRGDGGSSGGNASHNNDAYPLNYTNTPGTPATVYAGGDTMSLGLGATLFALSQLQKEALMALITNVTVISGRLLGILGLFYPSPIEPDPKVHIHVKDFDIDNPHVLVTLPAENITRVPVEDIPKNTSVPADVIARAVIDELAKTRPVAITRVESTPVPVVKAQKTGKPNVYTAQVIPGMKPVRITVDTSRPVKPATDKPGLMPAPKQYLSAPEEKDNMTHHAVIDFGGDHAPLYVSLTKQVKPEEEKKQAEEARKEWVADNPAGVSKVLADLSTLINAKNKQLAEKQQTLKNKQAEFQAFLDKYQNAIPFVKNGVNFRERERTFKSEIDQINADILSIRKELTDAAGNKALNEKTLAELNEQERNQTKTLEEAEKELAAADAALSKARALVTEKEKQLAAKQQALKSKQAEFQAFLDKYQHAIPFVKRGINFRGKERDFQAAIGQLSGEVGLQEKALSDAMESRKKAEGKKKAAEDKVKEAKDKKGKTPELKFDKKIKDQMTGRGWSEQNVKDTVAHGPKGKSVDKRSPKKTPPDYLGRNDPATVYGKPGEYVVVNDRTGEVVQVSDKKDPEWADDSRIQWEGK